ncbi:hypothetical protein B484DRAFT_236985 [Ochromonadaceae sp. CCMP2298]|nr:hypothetical protein B484DRAFT_236985 [Ochromonadaceae sp. CCMP2298]
MENSYKQKSTLRQSVRDGQGGKGFEVLMDGTHSYSKTRSNLEILIVNHPQQLCIELVAYDTQIGVEAERIYINLHLLASKINPHSVDFREKLSAWKDILYSQMKTFDIADLRKEVYNELMVKYILRRLNVDGDLEPTQLRVSLLALTEVDMSSRSMKKLDIVCEMPLTLDPVKVTFAKAAR